jgi:hypothetical protein
MTNPRLTIPKRHGDRKRSEYGRFPEPFRTGRLLPLFSATATAVIRAVTVFDRQVYTAGKAT